MSLAEQREQQRPQQLLQVGFRSRLRLACQLLLQMERPRIRLQLLSTQKEQEGLNVPISVVEWYLGELKQPMMVVLYQLSGFREEF